jgi:hypothetical protein
MRLTRWSTLVIGLLLPVAAVSAVAAAPAASVAQPLANPVWLCRPGLVNNLCNQDLRGNPQTLTPDGRFVDHYPGGASTPLDATSVSASGSTSYESFGAPVNPAVDCFYVYPTVDTVSNPLLQVGSLPPTPQDQEMAVTLAQAARFSGLCRMFVPVYRQAPLTSHAVGALLGTSIDYSTGQMDIQQAWTDYWTNYNVDPVTHRHRGVVLLGHSQGSAVLARLIQQNIDGNSAVQPSLVSAILLGGNVAVPIGAAAGGGTDTASTFQYVPACQRASAAAVVPTGCVVAYSSYDLPAGQAPPSNGMGRNTAAGHQILCVNPSALLGGSANDSATTLDAYLPTRKLLNGNALNPNGSLGLVMLGFTPPDYPTGFAHYPATLTGQCSFKQDSSGNSTWLQVTGGDALFPASTKTSALGLHVVDYNVALGDLGNLVAAQSTAWLAAHR